MCRLHIRLIDNSRSKVMPTLGWARRPASLRSAQPNVGVTFDLELSIKRTWVRHIPTTCLPQSIARGGSAHLRLRGGLEWSWTHWMSCAVDHIYPATYRTSMTYLRRPLLIYDPLPLRTKGWVDPGSWLNVETVAHPSTNLARRRVTSLIETTAPVLRLTATVVCSNS